MEDFNNIYDNDFNSDNSDNKDQQDNSNNKTYDVPSIIPVIGISIIILLIIGIVFAIFSGNEDEKIYPNFNSSHYIEIAQKEAKKQIVGVNIKFNYWEAHPKIDKNNQLKVVASGKVTFTSYYNVKMEKYCVVIFDVNLEKNTYKVYKPYFEEWS